MPEDDADFMVFLHVRVIAVAAQALFCAIEGKRVWLPRHHIKGDLLCRGDCGPLSVRCWVARDRQLTSARGREAIPPVQRSVMQHLPGRLHLLPNRSKAPLGH